MTAGGQGVRSHDPAGARSHDDRYGSYLTRQDVEARRHAPARPAAADAPHLAAPDLAEQARTTRWWWAAARRRPMIAVLYLGATVGVTRELATLDLPWWARSLLVATVGAPVAAGLNALRQRQARALERADEAAERTGRRAPLDAPDPATPATFDGAPVPLRRGTRRAIRQVLDRPGDRRQVRALGIEPDTQRWVVRPMDGGPPVALELLGDGRHRLVAGDMLWADGDLTVRGSGLRRQVVALTGGSGTVWAVRVQQPARHSP